MRDMFTLGCIDKQVTHDILKVPCGLDTLSHHVCIINPCMGNHIFDVSYFWGEYFTVLGDNLEQRQSFNKNNTLKRHFLLILLNNYARHDMANFSNSFSQKNYFYVI